MNPFVSSQNTSMKSNLQKRYSTHPKVSEMVNCSIANLKERTGSSLHAIKKYIGGHYEVNVEKLSPFIKKYLKQSVDNGTLIQTKGEGANGSFKLKNSEKKKRLSVHLPKSKISKPLVDKKKTTKRKTAKKVVKKKRVVASKTGKAKLPEKRSDLPKVRPILKGRNFNFQAVRAKFLAKKQRNFKKKLGN